MSLIVLRLSNFALYFTLYLLEIYFIAFLRAIVVNNGGTFNPIFKYIGYIVMVVSIGALVFDQFTHVIYYFDRDNLYHRGDMYYLALVPVFACFVLIIATVIYHRQYISRLQRISLMVYLSFPIGSAVIMVITGQVSSVINIAISIALVMMYLFYEVEKNQRMLRQAEVLVEQEKINNNFKNTMLWTQIQPHFIYNNLNVIQFLCEKDPTMAADAVKHLSAFLRSYIDAYDLDVCIPITEEMEIIEHYIYMQKLRYENKLNVDINVEATNFSVPPLSIECLVENSVRHGVARKVEGGKVDIHVWESEGEYLVEVADNGIGFDSDELKQDGKNHVGLKNTDSRLRFMINGSLEVISKPGEGCRSIVHVPKRK
jgi:sensor histidine kinase YesM